MLKNNIEAGNNTHLKMMDVEVILSDPIRLWAECYMNTEAVLKLINSPTKTHTDHHNGDLQIPVFSFSDSCLLPSGVFKNDQSSLNYSLNYLINFNTASVFIA